MKMFSKFVAAAALALAQSAAADPAGCDAGETVLKFSLVTSLNGHPKGEAALAYAEAINAEMDGRYCMEVYGSSELYADGPELFDAMNRGEVHFAAPSMSKLGDFTKGFLLFDIPFIFDGPLHVLEFLDTDAARDLLLEIEDDGLVGLGFWSNGMRHFSATVPMRLPGDAEGLTFRVQSSSPVTLMAMDIMGITAKKLAFSKVYDALASGEVQGQQNTWSNIQSKGFYLEQAAVTQTNHTYLGYVVMASKAFFDGIPASDRQVFIDTMKLVTHERNRFAFEINQARRQDILDDEGIIIRLAPQEVQAWRDAFAPILTAFRDEIGANLIDAAIRSNAQTDPYN